MERYSLLYPLGTEHVHDKLTDETLHDLSVDTICDYIIKSDKEKRTIYHILSRMPKDAKTIAYRLDVFEDILNNKKIRERLQKLLDRVEFLSTYSSFGKESDATGVWLLIHRLSELDEYIDCIDAIGDCLDKSSIRSDGLIGLREYVRQIYEDNGYEALKKDIAHLKMEASEIKSVTLGVNLNDRLEPIEIGINAINKKVFTESKILHNLSDMVKSRDKLRDKADWNGSYDFRTIKSGLPIGNMPEDIARTALGPGMVSPPGDSKGEDIMRSLDRAATALLTDTCKKLRDILSRHVSVNISIIIDLIPELLYYVRWAEFVEKLMSEGHKLCKPTVLPENERCLKARGLYNIKLTSAENSETIVGNDIDFASDKRIYILTGANRGGKTTITQAVGIACLMAQSGIFVPADSFEFSPMDNIFTHFPADENKTMDLGRLGEESKRFREIFSASTGRTLLLLNESFSTTSFEEGYYIARDITRSIAKRGCSTIFNTHMHALARAIPEINDEGSGENLVQSLIVESDAGHRSFKVRVAPPEGNSYAMDIARKYGVTYEQLMDNDDIIDE